MITTKKEDLLRKHNLLGEYVGQHLNTIHSAVNIIAQEEKCSRS